jgi:hypothetical protein
MSSTGFMKHTTGRAACAKNRFTDLKPYGGKKK